MSVNRTYKLPWKRLDPDEITAAAAAVAASFPGLSVTVERYSPTAVRCYFTVPRDVPQEWRGPAYDAWFSPGQPPVALPLLVEVNFKHLPADADDPDGLFLMSVDVGYSANEPLWPLATEIMDRFCRHWGIKPEWW